MNRTPNWPCEDLILFIWGLWTEYWSRVFFFVTSPLEEFFSSDLTRLWQPITLVLNLEISKSTTFSESPGHILRQGGTLDESYYWKILSNSSFSFSCFACFWGFQQRAPDVACIKHWIWPFELFHWIFACFHIVCDRYTSDYAHFTFSDTIWSLSLPSDFGNRSCTHIDTASYLGLMKTVKWRKEILGSGMGPVITIKWRIAFWA